MGADAVKWHPDDPSIQIILKSYEIDSEEWVSPRVRQEHHGQITRALRSFSIDRCLPALTCPVLAMLTIPPKPHTPEEQDTLTQKRLGVRRAGDTIPDLRVHWMEDTVHDAPLQRPKELGERIAGFIDDLPTMDPRFQGGSRLSPI
jgi:hypothetical protein